MKTKELKKKTKTDLLIIFLSAVLPMVIYLFFEQQWRVLNQSEETNFWVKFIVQCLLSYSLAGLGFTITMLIRKETFRDFGLVRKNLLPSILFSTLSFMPHLLFLLIKRGFHGYVPMSGAIIFDSVMLQSFPTKFFCMIVIFLIWGFCEGFTYVYLHKKINILIPPKNKWVNVSAIILGLLCVFLHGGISTDIVVIFDALTMFIFIYGSLITKDLTGNAWGIILSFLLLWNAFPA